MLKELSEQHLSEYSRQFKSIELEWENTYAKFLKLAGRMDRERQLTQIQSPTAQETTAPLTRSDLLRKHRGGAIT